MAFIITEFGTLYRTIDGGATWNDESPKLQNFSDTNYVSEIYVSVADPLGLVWYIVSGSTISWITRDGGNTYKMKDDMVVIDEIFWHPQLPNVVVRQYSASNCLVTGICFDSVRKKRVIIILLL